MAPPAATTRPTTARTPRHALILPNPVVGDDAPAMVEYAVAAEQAGWDGVFVWDHIAYRAPVQAVDYAKLQARLVADGQVIEWKDAAQTAPAASAPR